MSNPNFSALCPSGPIRTGSQTPVRQSEIVGVIVHTTGTGVSITAQERDEDSMDVACRIYKNGEAFPGYVIGQQGQIAQIVSDALRAPHAGISSEEKTKYKNGSWKKDLSVDTVRLWVTKHSSKESPLCLLPHNAIGVNDCYLGIECIQLLTPNSDGTYYTPAQMNTLIALIKDIRMRHPTAKQLLGHEDINPLRRSSKSGGWDPGALRDKPWFDWKRVLIGIGDLPPDPVPEHDDTTNMSFF